MDKQEVIITLKAILDERMKIAWEAMEAAQQSANEQGKSTVGDKYETSRSMGQLDRDMHARQYEQVRQERVVLERVNEKNTEGPAALGSLLKTSAGWFFIAVSIGPVKIKEETVMAVSSSSPVGAMLLGRIVGDQFEFVKKKHEIQAIV